jgi:hypothetical protein
MKVSEVDTGQFIVERTSSSSASMIDQLADSLGAKKLRSTQIEFKKLMNQRIDQLGGFVRFESEIRTRAGVETTSLRRWVYDPRSIAPHAYEDFLKVMTYLDKEDHAERMWKDMVKIRNLHLKAGRDILARLKKALLETDIFPSLKKDGFALVSVPECGTLGVFKVEHIGKETIDVSANVVDVILMDGGK